MSSSFFPSAENAFGVSGNGLIDFHTHVLPGMDDGSSSVQESLQMLEASMRQGVFGMVLTPHFYANTDNPVHFLEKRSRSLDKLKQHMRIPMPLLIPGAEVQYFSGITEVKELTQLCVDQTDLLLIEMPFRKWSSRVLDDVMQLNSRDNLRIVIAHIDRYLEEQPKGTLEYLVNNRVLIQANAEYFIRFFHRYKALRMLDQGDIHLLGSDCHNMTSRPPQMGECFRIIRSKLGSEAAERIRKNTVQLLLHDQKIRHFDSVKADNVLI